MGDRLMRRPDVEETTGLSRSSIYRQMEEGTFPRSVRVTAGSVRWRKSDIDDWMESLPVTGGDAAGQGDFGRGRTETLERLVQDAARCETCSDRIPRALHSSEARKPRCGFP